MSEVKKLDGVVYKVIKKGVHKVTGNEISLLEHPDTKEIKYFDDDGFDGVLSDYPSSE